MKLSITGSFGFMDIGDEAMLSEDLNYILNQLGVPPKDVFLFGGDHEYISYYHNHPIENCFNDLWIRNAYIRDYVKPKKEKRSFISVIKQRGWQFPKKLFNWGENRLANPVGKDKKTNALSALSKSDAVLITGGGTINTRESSGKSLTRIHTLVSFFKQLRKPLFISGQTIGPLGLYKKHDQMAFEILNDADVLTVRDSYYSKRYLSVINCRPKHLVETFDDAYTLPYQKEIIPDEILKFVNCKTTYAVNVTDYISDTPEKKIYIANLCEDLIQRHKVNIVLVSHTLKDYFSLTAIYDMIRNSLKGHVIVPDTRYWRDRQLKKLISSCRIAIGGRYHFIVFAGTSNTPFIGLCGNHYSYIKQDGFARALGLEDFILTEKETWSPVIVKARIEKALSLNLDLSDKFKRPSLSMTLFGEWLRELELC